MVPFFIFLFFLFSTYGGYMLVTRKSAAQRARLEQRLKDVMTYSSGADDLRVNLSRLDILSEIPQLNYVLKKSPQAIKLKQIIDQSDLHLTVMRLFLFSSLAGLMAVLAVSVVSPSLLLAGVAGIIASVVPTIHVLWKRKQRLNKFLADLPESLELMSRALAAGHAFTESLNIIATEMPDPIATEFRRTYDEQNFGLSMKLALDNLVERMPLMDLKLCITAIMIQRETGGNLAEILEKVAHTIRERFRILEDLKTLTMSSRISAGILCGIPIFIALAMTVVNPDYMSILWNDPRGHKLIALAMGMQTAGVVMVHRILQIKI